ncbi:MAG: 23S rRNA (uracil(1939)-C(5))-methyltransferase RlmD [Lachnospiraceae bacterium]
MKKGQILEGIVESVEFPNKGIVTVITEEGSKSVVVKNCFTGQKISLMIHKIKRGSAEGRLLQVLEKSPIEIDSPCPHFGECGGCTYQNLPYEEQLHLKQLQVRTLLEPIIQGRWDTVYEGIKGSPQQFGYRNKMEFSFGDEYKDGPLSLGMHKRGSFYDVVNVSQCQIVDADYRAILAEVLTYCKEQNANFYHRIHHNGYLRHLLVRKAQRTGEILIALVTSTQDEIELTTLADRLLALQERDGFQGTIVGILHTKNDSVADVIQNDATDILYGRDYFYEELLGLRFKISQFSFFQTNSLGAEVLYETAREYIGQLGRDVSVFDLYSGTGTIAQILAPIAKKVIGVEIVAEAVESAKENAKLNGLTNCTFIAGDVLKALDEITDIPNLIVLDPPRDGIHPGALSKICDYAAPRILYISCKPTSLARDLVILQERGYAVERVGCVDMFPGSVHVECVCLLERT